MAGIGKRGRGRPFKCDLCWSTNTVRKGTRGSKLRILCKSCGSWSTRPVKK